MHLKMRTVKHLIGSNKKNPRSTVFSWRSVDVDKVPLK